MGLPATRHGDVELFIRLDTVGASLGIALVIVINSLVVQAPGVWFVIPCLAALTGALVLARRAIASDQLLRALSYVAAGNWLVAVVIPLILPFLWPVMTLTVLMPLVLASPHLDRRQIVRAIVSAAGVTAVVALIGLLNDDGGAIADVDDELELIVVICALTAQIVPIGSVIWQHNQMQQATTAQLQTLNDELLTSEADLAASRNRVVEAADAERRRIEQDLHDGAQQRLVAMGVRLRLLQSQWDDDPGLYDGIGTVITELDGATEELRELAHGIYPPLLETRGLPDALAAVVRRLVIPIQTAIAPINRQPAAVEAALYFTALEALTNATKHAGPATIRLVLTETRGELMLQVADDGHGFDAEPNARSHGFHNMRDRLAAVGGHLAVVAAVGAGTTVTATVPNPP